jgi:hypothetical protein
MRFETRSFKFLLPSLGLVRIEKPTLTVKIPPKSAGVFLVAGEVDGERKAAQVWVVENLPHPIQVKSSLWYGNMIWLPASELKPPLPETVKVNVPPHAPVDVYRIIDIFEHAYVSNTLLHEFLHLWCCFESDVVEDILGAESEDLYNVVEDFFIQVLVLKELKKGFAFQPKWAPSNQTFRLNPSLPSAAHLINSLQRIGCRLEAVNIHHPSENYLIEFCFSRPKTSVHLLPSIVNELLMVQLAAYEHLARTLPHSAWKDEVVFNVELPLTLNKLLQDHLTNLDDKEVAGSLNTLYSCFKDVGEGVFTGLKPKSLKKMYDALIEYLSLKVFNSTEQTSQTTQAKSITP